MVSVRPRKGENPANDKDFDSLVRRFQHRVAQEGIMRELKRRESFEKPSDKRRRKAKESLWRNRK